MSLRCAREHSSSASTPLLSTPATPKGRLLQHRGRHRGPRLYRDRRARFPGCDSSFSGGGPRPGCRVRYARRRSAERAFSDYVLATADVACKMPEEMGFDEACAMPTALATAGLALFHELGLPFPGTQEARGMVGTPVLVSGAPVPRVRWRFSC